MKVTINFGEEINSAVQKHLETGVKVQDYVSAAVRFFNDMLRVESQENAVGFGDKSRFSTYNTVASPFNYLNSQIEMSKQKEKE